MPIPIPGSFHEFLFDWVWNVFIHGFCVSIIRPMILIGLALVLFNRFGAGLGLPHLFWRPRWWAQLCVGFVIGLLVWQVFLSGYLFEEFATNYTRDRAPFCEVRLPDTRFGPAVAWVTPPEQMLPSEAILNWSQHDHDERIPEENDFRFRYVPASGKSMLHYAWVVMSGFAVCGIVIFGTIFVAQWIAQRVRKKRGWTAAAPDRLPSPLPYKFWLPLGVVVGFFALAGATAAFCQLPVEHVCDGNRPSQWFLREWAGWGRASGRQEAVKVHVKFERVRRGLELNNNTQPVNEGKALNKARQGGECMTRTWFGPYIPVYDAFFLNCLFITMLLIGVMILGPDSPLVSPAVGILCLLNWVVAGHIFLNYFSPLPIDFVLLLFVGLVVASGRAYKFSFPNMPDAPDPSNTHNDHPLDLNKRYDRLLSVEVDLAQRKGTDNKPAREAYTVATHDPSAKPIKVVTPVFSSEVTYPATELELPAGKPPLALVCVSGGGSRAAAWTMKVLLELEKAFLKPHDYNWGSKPLEREVLGESVAFPYHIRLLTGASGGMIAGSYYVASLDTPTGHDAVNRKTHTKCPLTHAACPLTHARIPLTHDDLFNGVCKDFLTPIVHTLVTHDLPRIFSPFQRSWDRGRRLEETWVKELHGQLDVPLADLAKDEIAGWRPSLVFSPMLVEDGRQLFISNLDLRSVVRNRANLLGDGGDHNPHDVNDPVGRRLLSREGVEFFKLFPHATDFRIATAARMSATFPYVLPAVPLPTNPPRRVVDAGYYDNYGVTIAASWIFTHMNWIRTNTSGVVVIQIRDGASNVERRRERATDGFPSLPNRGLQWLTSPPEGLWNFRTAAHTFHDDNLLHLLNDFFIAQRHRPAHKKAGERVFDNDFFATIGFEFQEGDNVALSFTLTDWERKRIEAAETSEGFKGQVAALHDWWHQRLAMSRSGKLDSVSDL